MAHSSVRLVLTSPFGLKLEKEVVFGVLFDAVAGHADICRAAGYKKLQPS